MGVCNLINVDKPIHRIVEVTQLEFDPLNPRLIKRGIGKKQLKLQEIMLEHGIDEITSSMMEFGYFNEEPLVVTPANLGDKPADCTYDTFIKDLKTKFVVVEGNRRFTAIKIILDKNSNFRKKRSSTNFDEIEKNLLRVPAIVYKLRNDIIPYLGYRHIGGIRKWGPLATAYYIKELWDNNNYTIDKIKIFLNEAPTTIIRMYTCIKLLDKLENEITEIQKVVKNSFSLLLLAIGQNGIKTYLEIKESWSVLGRSASEKVNLDKLKDLFSYIFRYKKSSREWNEPVIKESRDITNKLKFVLEEKDAFENLAKHRDLDQAFELSEGKYRALIKRLGTVERNLSNSLNLFKQHYTDPEIAKLFENVKKHIKSYEKVFSQSEQNE